MEQDEKTTIEEIERLYPDEWVLVEETAACSRTRSTTWLPRAIGHVGLDWQEFVEIDPRYYRPAEVDLLVGDASKARRILGWEPQTKFKELVRLMVDADMGAVDKGRSRMVPRKV